MSIRFKLSLIFSLLFVAAVFNSAFLFKLELYGEEKLRWVTHTHKVLDSTTQLLSSMTDAETGQRGYLLTENTVYLEPYYSGVESAKEQLATLKRLTQDNPHQQQKLSVIEKQMTLKFDELAETIELVDQGKLPDALALVGQNTGKQFMDNIRALLSDFSNHELVLLEQRKGDVRENRTQTITLIAVELVFLIGLSVITIIYLKRGLFDPLKLLLGNARKIEKGDKLNVSDMVEKNEMGLLLSTFYRMSEKISEREQILDHKAHHDLLTGLKNRLKVNREFEQAIRAAEAHGDRIAALFIDLDGFKEVNDSLGHEVGDLLLKETAERLVSSVRVSDTVFRLGGDEFLVLARKIKDEAGLHGLVKKILNNFEPQAVIQGRPMDISISVGVATAPDSTRDYQELIKYADIAMYEAKRSSKSDYRVFELSMLKRFGDGV